MARAPAGNGAPGGFRHLRPGARHRAARILPPDGADGVEPGTRRDPPRPVALSARGADALGAAVGAVRPASAASRVHVRRRAVSRGRWRPGWVLAGCFAITLALVNPYVRGDGNGYYAYIRSLVIDGDLRFE